MTKREWAMVASAIEAMPAGRDQNAGWQEAQRVYAMVLGGLDYETVRAAVVWAAAHEDWRPSAARLRALAAEVADPLPGAERVYGEVLGAIQRWGLHARPVEGQPGCYQAGEPEWSHPIAGVVVVWCGGWEHLCTVDRAGKEPLSKEVARVYAAVARQWSEHVAQQLAFPPGERVGFIEAGLARLGCGARRSGACLPARQGGLARMGEVMAGIGASGSAISASGSAIGVAESGA